MPPTFPIRSKVHLFAGHAGWHFVTIDKKNSKIIKELFGTPRRGWGSIPVTVALGRSVWKTSIFPNKNGTYLMGLKVEVRKAEKVRKSDTVEFSIQIREV
jgi:hypothetical protein